MQENYSWVAQLEDGTTVSKGESLRGAIVVSLIPKVDSLPKHDFSGLRFERRFCRGFIRALGGGLREYVHCLVSDTCRLYVLSSNGSVIVTPPDYELYL